MCVGCQRRGTPCRSQEFGDDEAVTDEGLSVRARLIRVEILLEKLMEKVLPEERGDQDHSLGSAEENPVEKGPLSQFRANEHENTSSEKGSTLVGTDSLVLQAL